MAAAEEAGEFPGIPAARFISDVPGALGGRDPGALLQELQAQYQNYKMLEQRLMQARQRMQTKVPDIQKALDMIVLLMEKGEAGEGATVDFELVDHVFAKAEIQECQHVSLWLGANVMVEYEIGEAHALLQQNLSKAQSNLEQNERELAFVRDNVNTTEVGMARVYNYDVQLRRDMADLKAPEAAAAA